jgi:hypothetical protein
MGIDPQTLSRERGMLCWGDGRDVHTLKKLMSGARTSARTSRGWEGNEVLLGGIDWCPVLALQTQRSLAGFWSTNDVG